jgi:integrase
VDTFASLRHNPHLEHGYGLGYEMGRGIERLTALTVTRARKPGLYADGGHLYLQVTKRRRKDSAHQDHRRDLTRSWIFRFKLHGRARDMGLGSLHSVSLSQARAKARSARELLADGIDPIDAKRAAHEQAALDAGKAITFKEASGKYIAGHRAGWSNAKHAAQWESTLAAYAYPVIGALSVQAIDTTQVLKVLEPIWTTKTETASRLRARIELVLDWAKVRGHRKGENPARWRGHLDKLLVRPSKLRKVEHHSALPYAEIGDFMQALREQESTAARALEFLILTACRAGEVIDARWSEIHGVEKLWVIPPERMKAGKEHRVPLSPAALTVIERMRMVRDGEYLFPAVRPRKPIGKGKPLGEPALLVALKRMGRGNLTVHGFRSSFRDWCAERTNFPREVAEAALAHVVGDATERAYQRGDLFEKRRQLMDAWSRHCATVKENRMGEIVSIAR